MFVGERSLEECVGASLDEATTLGERPSELIVHGAGGFGDESGDQARCFAGAAGSRRSDGRLGDAVVEDGGDVVGVTKFPGLRQLREQSVDVVVVGLGSAQFGGECAERR
ncbi:hypothetical protein [Propionibacterium cyclohexanicum]|uniref:hypothetical protein n=1 Tax=Propionibacterium cyclohexanicum TaxID=64702 RepID=UPI000B84D2EB|nr:hypothetical protein [Propionibacterium cyclohexanicum]